MNFFDRLEQVADLKGLSITAFFQMSGVSPSTFVQAKSRGGTFSNSTWTKLQLTHLDVNMDYVKTGNGEPLQPISGVIQTALNVGGNNHQIIAGDPCFVLREELAAAQREISQLKDKIIALLERQQPINQSKP